MKKKIINVVGARPNFVKIAPLLEEMKKHSEIESILVHTGQHYDYEMDKIFFKDLNIPKPDIYLGVGSGSHAEQTAKIMVAFEEILEKERPDLIIVVGDVNSTLACSLVASKLQIPVAHIEAGLRSFNWEMPEEINRVITDKLSNYLFTTSENDIKNLIKENIPKEKVFFVGNIMIDTLFKNKEIAEKKSKILEELNLEEKNYAVLTLHRQENVDSRNKLKHFLDVIEEIQKDIKIVFPLHPRTNKRIEESNMKKRMEGMKNLIIVKPLGYIDFLKLTNNSKFVLTDSGGIQEETTVLGIPCLTLRGETERPITVEIGTNMVVGNNEEKILKEYKKIMKGKEKEGNIPKYWDGKTSERILEVILKELK